MRALAIWLFGDQTRWRELESFLSDACAEFYNELRDGGCVDDAVVAEALDPFNHVRGYAG